MATPRWYHGTISREDAEARIYSARTQYPGQGLFLVRKSAKDPHNFVLSCMQGRSDSRCNHIKLLVHIGGPGSSTMYQLSTGQGQAQPQFANIDQLIEHYKSASADAPAPLGIFVPTSEGNATPAVSAAAAAAAAVPAAVPAAAASPFANGAPIAPAQGQVALAKPNAVGLHVSTGSSQSDEELLCEGYLTKHRGVGQSRTRWFRLTTKKLTYYTKDAGELIASCLTDDIASVTDLDKRQMRVITREPFGQSHKAEMVLEAPNQRVKQKWFCAFRGETNTSGGMRNFDGVLVVEGYLVKVQASMTSADKQRWFVCTNKHFAYYKEESGEMMGSVPLENITSVGPAGDNKSFKVIANQRFTTTGSYEVVCRCESEAVRNKWLAQMQKVIPEEKFPH